MTDLRIAREQMVQRHIAARGIRDRALLEAMRTVPREAFLPPELEEFAYEDHPLPIAAGHLCRRTFGDSAYLIGFGTDHGSVAAAHDWDGPMDVMRVRPAHPQSYESLCHESGVPAFGLHLRAPRRAAVRDELTPPRLERAIGVVYRPATELQSHYFHASLPHQFDEYLYFDETRAVRPVTDADARRLPAAHPFAPYGPP